MIPSYDDAVAALYQAPLAGFVAERKRLAGELKAGGDKAGAARFLKLARPPASAWVVNQLWWHARDGFDALLAAAARVRDGDLSAAPAHRAALASLRVRAANLLADAGHGATESTLRRVALTLSALGAIGSFDPDPPGALTGDRDPPGFESMLGAAAAVGAAPAPPASARVASPRAVAAAASAAEDTPAEDAAAEDTAGEDSAAEDAAAAVAEAARKAEIARRRAEDEARDAERRERERVDALRAERKRLETELAVTAKTVAQRTRDLDQLRAAVASAEQHLTVWRGRLGELEAKLAELD